MKTAMKFAMKISRRLRVKSTIITPNRSLLNVFLIGGISESQLPTTAVPLSSKKYGRGKRFLARKELDSMSNRPLSVLRTF